jgi:hypothetical protein
MVGVRAPAQGGGRAVMHNYGVRWIGRQGPGRGGEKLEAAHGPVNTTLWYTAGRVPALYARSGAEALCWVGRQAGRRVRC